KQVRNAVFLGHPDTETAADLAGRILNEMKSTRVGIESWSAGLSHGFAQRLRASMDAEWTDVTGLVDGMRLVKSPAEQALMRKAAAVTDAAATAAIAAIHGGASEREVAAECQAA